MRYGDERPELRIDSRVVIDDPIERAARLAFHLGSSPDVDPRLGVKRVFVKRFPHYWRDRL